MKRCYEIFGCPVSYFPECPVYRMNKNCWDVEDLTCCREMDVPCKRCWVYKMGKG